MISNNATFITLSTLFTYFVSTLQAHFNRLCIAPERHCIHAAVSKAIQSTRSVPLLLEEPSEHFRIVENEWAARVSDPFELGVTR